MKAIVGIVLILSLIGCKEDSVNFSSATGQQGPQGKQGVAGVNGNKIYSDFSTPNNLNGADGDVYVNNTTFDFYQKVSGVWTLSGNIKGQQGAQGLTGVQGATGPQGVAGAQGLAGLTGAAGLQGIQGLNGAQGVQGLQGLKGDTGATGLQGIQGIAGTAGANGTKIYSNKGVPNVGSGNNGDFYIDQNNFQFYQNINGTWVIEGSLVGAQGIQGIAGLNGTNGVDGALGPKGDTGVMGLQGVQGLTGITGAKGDTGLQGVKGDTGLTGAAGPQGLQGVIGAQGIAGAQGVAGPQGPAGSKGSVRTSYTLAKNVCTQVGPVYYMEWDGNTSILIFTNSTCTLKLTSPGVNNNINGFNDTLYTAGIMYIQDMLSTNTIDTLDYR